MTDRFDRLLSKFNLPEQATRPAEARLAELEGHLPADLLAFWRAYGIGMWRQGRFQFCLPQRFRPLGQRIFAGDPQLKPEETHIIGFSAFGELLAWNEQHQRVLIDLPYFTVRAPKFNESKPEKNYPLTTPLFRLEFDDSFDFYDDTPGAEPLFARARARLGQLEMGECYGFVPALPLGGTARLDHLDRMDALVHFCFLADLGRCRLMVSTAQDAPETVARVIGS